MALIDKETIRTEIGRLKENYLNRSYTFVPAAMQQLLEFLDTLPEKPVSEELEEAARLYAIPSYVKDMDEDHLEEYPYDKIVESAFLAGAEWQKNQMMKDAVEGEYDSYPAAIYLETPVQEIEHGDKVHIIIVKEE